MIPKPGISRVGQTDRSHPEASGAEDAVERVEENFRTRKVIPGGGDQDPGEDLRSRVFQNGSCSCATDSS